MVPHRQVFREQAETTKVRPVFDGFVHHKGRRSFNANLEVGPNMKTHIMGILMRFRHEKQEEGKKAFLQILIHPDHCQIVRFIWVDDLNAENPTFKVYCWKRLVRADLKSIYPSGCSHFAPREVRDTTSRHNIQSPRPDLCLRLDEGRKKPTRSSGKYSSSIQNPLGD
jgi:hypothetical protein